MAFSFTSHKRALSGDEEPSEPSPKKAASGKLTAHHCRVGEDAAMVSTTDADALWRQLPIAKPARHSAVYCLDDECEKHGSPVRTQSAEHKNTENGAAENKALPARTVKQP